MKAKKEKGLLPPDWTFRRELIAECGKYVIPNEPFPARVAKRDLKAKKNSLVAPAAPAAPAEPPAQNVKPLPFTPRSSLEEDVSTLIYEAIIERYQNLSLHELKKLTTKQVRADLEDMLNMNLEPHKSIIEDQLTKILTNL